MLNDSVKGRRGKECGEERGGRWKVGKSSRKVSKKSLSVLSKFKEVLKERSEDSLRHSFDSHPGNSSLGR